MPVIDLCPSLIASRCAWLTVSSHARISPSPFLEPLGGSCRDAALDATIHSGDTLVWLLQALHITVGNVLLVSQPSQTLATLTSAN